MTMYMLYDYEIDQYENSSRSQVSAAGVVVSCKIPILVTRVRFSGGAHIFAPFSIFPLKQ